MGRNDAAKIAQQLIDTENKHSVNTPVHILEAVSTRRERHWSSTLGELAKGKADAWFDSNSPALIMIGEALRANSAEFKIDQKLVIGSDSSGTEVDDGLQNGQIFTNSRRRA
jgi:uroporphyrin-III C-methyltransferase